MGWAIELPPFSQESELVQDAECDNFVKRLITRNASDTASQSAAVAAFLGGELTTPVLDELHDRLWLVARKSRNRIDALHLHVVKRREIVVAEDPGLHLVWKGSAIYLKPIPPCLLNYQFWLDHLVPSRKPDGSGAQPGGPVVVAQPDILSAHCRAALGFVRTYSLLIQHESDFCIAQERGLVPSSASFLDFKWFVDGFFAVPEDYVAPRWQYSQLRLRRLNLAVRLLRPRVTGSAFPWYYHRQRFQTLDYVRDYGAPILAVFAFLSLALGALQVMLAAQALDDWTSVISFGWVFSILVLAILAVVVGGFVFAASTVVAGYHRRYRRGKHEQENTNTTLGETKHRDASTT